MSRACRSLPLSMCTRRPFRDDVERDPDLAAVVQARAEVGVEPDIGADRADDRVRVRRDGQRVDPLVPRVRLREDRAARRTRDRKSTRLNSSHITISYAVFCLKKKKKKKIKKILKTKQKTK